MKPRLQLFLALLCLLTALPRLSAQQATIDTAALHSIQNLDQPWLFSAGDDPSFAAPSFDDSAWTPLKPGQVFARAHLPKVSGYAWARLHLHVLNAAAPLGIAVLPVHAFPYAVFANGRQIAISPSMDRGLQENVLPFVIALPASPVGTPPAAEDIVLAVRVFIPESSASAVMPLRRIQIGQLSAVANATELARFRGFEEGVFAPTVCALIFFAFAVLGFSLFFFQRDREKYIQEYLWMGVLCLFVTIFIAVDTALFQGALPFSTANDALAVYSGWLCMLTSLEFVVCISRTEGRRAVRFFQACLLLAPPAYFVNRSVYSELLTAAFAIWLLLVSYLLVRAYRSGSVESGLLMPPLAIWAFGLVLESVTSFYPRTPWAAGIHIGHVGISVGYFANGFLAFGLGAVVLLRFVRVTRDEQKAVAELEAARNVQELLITHPPELPGYTVESVYLPAGQVGGDFFHFAVAPKSIGSAGSLGSDGSLLIVAGDVSGKGLRAAMAVSAVIGALRNESSRSPAIVLQNLNRMICGHIAGFVTCAAALLEADGTLRIASAGNPPPYLDGVELSSPPNLPLGIARDAAYEEAVSTLAPGQRLVFCSDGIPEAADPATRELFGFDRTQTLSTEPARVIAETARAFGQNDDITVLAITRLPHDTRK